MTKSVRTSKTANAKNFSTKTTVSPTGSSMSKTIHSSPSTTNYEKLSSPSSQRDAKNTMEPKTKNQPPLTFHRISFTLPYPPSTNNRCRYVNGKVLISKQARIFQKNVLSNIIAWRTQNNLPIHATIFPNQKLLVITLVHPPDNKRRDLDNVDSKAIFDALQHAGIFTDDSQIRSRYSSFQPPIPNGKILVTIKTLQEH